MPHMSAPVIGKLGALELNGIFNRFIDIEQLTQIL